MSFSFDPNAAASPDSGIFGLPFKEDDSALVLIPVPWEATASYGGGTASGPSAILKASHQVDLYDLEVLKPYEAGICMLPESSDVRRWNEEAKTGGVVNELSVKLNEFVFNETARLIEKGKSVGIVGGEHSVPVGAIQAVARKYRSFGILHIDAHSDTRLAFEGLTYSHASIMRNVLDKIPEVSKIVQVAIRDVCEEEMTYALSQKDRLQIFFDRDFASRKFEGVAWGQMAREIVSLLPNEVWVSFDIDGMDPRLCPNTGTPVPGGIDFWEASYLFSTLVRSGRRIIGFDLSEVSPGKAGQGEWDANVGARILYKLCAWMLASQNKAKVY